MKNVAASLCILLAACGGGGGSDDLASGVQVERQAQQMAAVGGVTEAILNDFTDDVSLATFKPSDVLVQKIVPIASLADGIDRDELLRQLFAKTVAGRTGIDAAEVWTASLQKRFMHPKYAPIHEDGSPVMDPVALLRIRVAKCGQINALLVRGLVVMGYQARTVHIMNAAGRGHVAAEVKDATGWHHLDADWLNDGSFVRKPDGTIPSAAEIAANLSLLDTVSPNWEMEAMDAMGANVRFTDDTMAGMFARGIGWYQVWVNGAWVRQ